MVKLAKEQIPAYNDGYVQSLENGNIKEAADIANAYTRLRIREESFAEKIVTPIDIANDELDKAQDPEFQVKWVDREPDTAPATTVPLGVVPRAQQFKGDRVPVYFGRVMSHKYKKDISKLRGYDYDIRQVLFDHTVKDVATEIDTNFINTVNSVVGTANTSNVANTGLAYPNYITVSGGITRESFVDAVSQFQYMKVPFGKMQPDGNAQRGVMLCNNITAQQFLKWNRSEVGGDASQKMLESGEIISILGIPTIPTIKHELIPTGTFYLFSSEEFLGKYFRLQALTTYMKTESWWIEFFMWTELGITITNNRAVFRADFI